MEIKTKNNKENLDSLIQTHDPLKGTVWDNIFGNNSPLRKCVNNASFFNTKDIDDLLELWTQEDKLFSDWITIRRLCIQNKILNFLPIPQFSNKELKGYFYEKEENKDIERIDVLEKKYDIPELAIALRKFDMNLAIIYFLEQGNERFITEDVKKNSICHSYNEVFHPNLSYGEVYRFCLIAHACFLGSIKYIEWLFKSLESFEEYCENNGYYCYYAAKGGHIHVLEWLRDFEKEDYVRNWNEECCEVAAKNGHLHVLKWLRDPETGGGVCPWNETCCSFAVINGHFNVLKWLRDPNTGGGVCPWNEWCCYSAIKNNRLDMLKWLRDPNTGEGICPWSLICFVEAIENGHIDIIEYMRDPNTGGVCPWDELCCAYAAQNGHLHILKWLRDPDTGGGVCPWDGRCCVGASLNDHLNVLKWLRDPNTGGGVCPWNWRCCYSAIKNNRLDMLKWLRDPNTGEGVCLWNEECCKNVHCEEISDWMKANGCPCNGTLH